MSRKIASAVALTACLAASSAQADNVLFTGFADGSENVTLSTTVRNGTVPAGGLATSLNGGPSFTTYCIDLVDTITFGVTYTDYTQVPGASFIFPNSDAYLDLSKLFGLAGNPVGATMEAAFQMAVWEIVYETGPTYNLAAGSATFAGSAGATSQAATWLATLASLSGGPALTVLSSQLAQDVIYAPVPEPETYALMLAGLAVLGSIAKRRAKAKAAA